MLGNGAMVFWHDFAAGADGRDFHEWHSKEHLAERVGIPGFRRGYRYERVEGASLIFVMYEVEDVGVLTSDAYLARLNDPSPWTRRAMGYFANNNRTLCRVRASVGRGVAGHALTLQIRPDRERADAFRKWLASEALPGLLERPGVVAAHLLEGDAGASATETEEKQMRGVPDAIADWVLIVNGYDADALRAARDHDLGVGRLRERGLAELQAVGLYRLLHCITDVDLEAAA